MDLDQINQKSYELMIPIIKQINMTDNETELTLLAMLMMNRARDILDQTKDVLLEKNCFLNFLNNCGGSLMVE